MFISDSHNDFLTTLQGLELENYNNSHEDSIISSAIFTTNKNYSLNTIKSLSKIIRKKKNLILSIEDLGFIKSIDELNKLIKLKPFSTTLTWNDINQYAGGANSNLGLTDLGIETIKKLEKSNIIIDTAHLSRKSFYDFIDITAKPIYNSHSNIDSLFSHNRNLTDDQISHIVNSNGYMGITLYQKFISNTPICSFDIALQFDYLIRNFSSYHFGFGTDFYGIDNDFLPIDISCYDDLNKVANHLLSFGHNYDIVERIMYKNFLEFTNFIN